MRAYDIALFLFIFNLMLAVFSDPRFTFGTRIQSGGGAWSESTLRERMGSVESIPSTQPTGILETFVWFGENLRFVVQSAPFVISALANSTIFLPWMLNSILSNIMGSDSVLIAGPLGLMMIFVYIMGLIQFWMGRSTRDIQ